ncbi:CotH kinase family protein [Sunxiuqinia sp. A32]|uniref:CotH kinase family protein n=1 Tax=Sunxiuqinia sp. A32 TaxID=3461496 RepID=UPI00404552B1
MQLVLLSYTSVGQELHFNEVMPSNVTTILDEDQDYPDWFELYNNSDHDIQLKDYRISDDENFESAWIFPNCQIKSGGYVLIYASGKNRNPDQKFWETVINQGDEWHYILPNQNINNWYKNEFDDSDWNIGKTGIGYSDGDDSTIIASNSSVYLRDTFQIEHIDQIVSAILHIDYDDGFIAYLNGTEIARSSNMGSAGQAANFDDFTSIDHEAKMYQGGLPEEFPINNFYDLLVEGENLLAIEIHNRSYDSSDMSAIPFLSFERTQEPDEYRTAEFLDQKGNLHTNFKLDADGDSLFLFSPNGALIDEMIIPVIGPDISLGFINDNYTNIYAFEEATPGFANSENALMLSDSIPVIFNLESGIYDSEISVSLSTDNTTDTIYYTTNGSDPTTGSHIYTTEIELNYPATIRARVLRSGVLPGEIYTNSYFPKYNKDLPVAFFSTNPKNLWDYNEGIYVKGPNAQDGYPFFNANFWQDWEKPAHIELYLPEEKQSFSIDGGIKIFGNYSRAIEQKSLAVFARKMYGAGSIDCKLFEDRPFTKFESVVFRNSGNDWHGTGSEAGSMFRDVVMTKIADKMQLDIQAGRPVVTYLNGQYWGIQNLREKVNEHFLAAHKNEDPEKMDILLNNRQVVEGSAEHYNNMQNLLTSTNLTLDQNYQQIARLIDIPNFIKYQIAQIFFNNRDWPGNNIKYWRPQRANGKWRWILYDSDFGLGLWNLNKAYENSMVFATKPDGPGWPNPPWSTLLLRKLLENESFKNEFINTFADHLNSTFLPSDVKSIIDYQIDLIQNEIVNHINKWGGNFNTWVNNNSKMKQFAEIRPGIMRGHLVGYFNLNGQQSVQLNIQGCDSATIKLNTIRVKEFPWQGIYFNNVPIKLTAVPPKGFRFKEWQGIVSSDPTIEVSMNSNRNITAVFESYQPEENEGVIINEISYNSAPEADSKDWVELYNNSNNYIDISNWILQDSDEANHYTIEANTLLSPHEYLVVARDLEAFPEVFPMIENVIGQLGFGFTSAGECVRLYNEFGELEDEVCYANEYPWPSGADGGGYTLSLRSPEMNNSLGANWINSKFLYGTPGGNNDWATGIEAISANSKSELMNCYPNPFSETLFIPVNSAGHENIKIDILNLNGQVIQELYNDLMPFGNQTIEWNFSNYQSGFYIIRMQTADNIQIKKVLKTTN